MQFRNIFMKLEIRVKQLDPRLQIQELMLVIKDSINFQTRIREAPN